LTQKYGEKELKLDVIFDLAKNIVNTGYDDLPKEAVENVKNLVIDSIGVGIAGSTDPYNRKIIDMLWEWGGEKESTIMVYGHKVPTPEAVFANSLLIHTLDFDETHDQAATHSFVTVLPSALGTAEKVKCSGKALITAIALGVEITNLLVLVPRLFHGWHFSGTTGVFGAAVAAGKILGLDEEKMVDALGIAYSQAGGNRQGRVDGALTKRLQPPFAAKAGVISALFAQQGITGARNVIEGEWGFFRLFHDYEQKYEPDKWAAALKADFGSKFEVTNITPKPYPCVRASHASIDSALAIARKYNIKPEDIEEVVVYTNQRVLETCGQPFAIRTNPQVDAQFSIPYTVAVALTRRKVGLSDFEEKIVRDPGVFDLAKRVKVVVAPEFKDSRSVVGPIRIKVKTRSGKEFQEQTAFAKGHLENPMTEEDIIRKFRDCVGYSGNRIAEDKITRLLDTVKELDKVSDVSRVTGLLS
jgi:2-methylcitrate dehydratase PrpD